MIEDNANQPIEIIVVDGRWDAFGPVTPRSKELLKILKAIGGVSESVPDGHYYFNAEIVDEGENTYAYTLIPSE